MFSETNIVIENQAREVLSNIRSFMILKYPFFGVVASNLELVIDYQIDIMATDGKVLYYNPLGILDTELKKEHLVFIIMHEVMHITLDHVDRNVNYKFDIWNEACDYAVNDILVTTLCLENNKDFEIPKDLLYNKVYHNMSAETIYFKLLEDIKNDNNNNQTNDNGLEFGVDISLKRDQSLVTTHDLWKESNTSKREQLNHNILIKQAYEGNKTHCSTPKAISLKIKNLNFSKTNWRELLYKFCEPLELDYSFNPPDNRFHSYDFFLPMENVVDNGIKDIYFYVDTSSSINDEELKEFSDELVSCFSQFENSSKIMYGSFSVVATEPKELENINQLDFCVSGGTEPKCIFRKLNELELLDTAKAIIIFTDGYFEELDNSLANDIPVLWVVSKKGVFNYLSNWDNVIRLE